jgi:hypothetical protein
MYLGFCFMYKDKSFLKYPLITEVARVEEVGKSIYDLILLVQHPQWSMVTW